MFYSCSVTAIDTPLKDRVSLRVLYALQSVCGKLEKKGIKPKRKEKKKKKEKKKRRKGKKKRKEEKDKDLLSSPQFGFISHCYLRAVI